MDPGDAGRRSEKGDLKYRHGAQSQRQHRSIAHRAEMMISLRFLNTANGPAFSSTGVLSWRRWSLLLRCRGPIIAL